MELQARLRAEAQEEYVKEKGQVDAVVKKMINEDHESLRLQNAKKDQSKNDMVLSVMEKKANERRQRDLEQQESEMVRRYA